MYLAVRFTMVYDSVRLVYRVLLGRVTMGRIQAKSIPMHFKTMVQSDVPQGREGVSTS